MSDPVSARKLRPWYLLVAMSVTWMVGVLGATGACAQVSYLRGSQQLPDALDAQTAGDEPLARLPVVMESARLEALATYYRRAFPLGIAQLLLCALLAITSGAAIAGRRGARSQALQALAANATLAALSYLLMTPVREAVADAVARDMAEHGRAGLQQLGAESGVAALRSLYLWVERFRFALVELGVYGGAALALTRPRTRRFFDAAARARGSAAGDG